MVERKSIAITEEQVRRLIYSAWDFQQALSAVTFLTEDSNLDEASSYTDVQLRRLRCYETQAIISFCRPFVPSRSGVQLSLKLIRVSLTPEEGALKEQLLDMRNRIMAHSDPDEMHYKSSVIKLYVPIDEGLDFRFPLVQYDEWMYLKSDDRKTLTNLLKRLIRRTAEAEVRICQANPELFSNYSNPTHPRPFKFKEVEVHPPLELWRSK